MEPEKEKNPQPENVELLEPDNSETAKLHELDNELGDESNKQTIRFKDRFFTIRYQPENRNDIHPKLKENFKNIYIELYIFSLLQS